MAAIENSQGLFGVIGVGVTGKLACKYLKGLGANVIAINRGPVESWSTDEFEGIECFSQEDPRIKDHLKNVKQIILSPGVPRTASVIQGFKGEIINDIELFFRHLQSRPKIIAITGSNGKTSTVSLLTEILKSAGESVFLGGNIGQSPLQYLLDGEKENNVVLELSSFQLESIVEFKPDIAGVLNVQMTHEERYENFQEYFEAKFRLFNNVDDGCFSIIDQHSNEYIDRHCSDHIGQQLNNHEHFYVYDQDLEMEKFKDYYDLSCWAPPGEHNLKNLKLCTDIAKFLGLNKEQIEKGFNQFKGIEHRIEFVGSVNDALTFNDSKSTNIFSTKTALKAFDGKKICLMLGGQIRDPNSINMAEIKKVAQSVHQLITFGELSHFENSLPGISFKSLRSMDPSKIIEDTEIILFSPGFPSFDEFNNYQERGNAFKDIINKFLIEKK